MKIKNISYCNRISEGRNVGYPNKIKLLVKQRSMRSPVKGREQEGNGEEGL